MSTETSYSQPGYVPMKNTLEEASLTQLVNELALRLIGPEKAKLLKSSGVNLDALCQALSQAQTATTQSTHGSAETKKKDTSTTSTYHPVYDEKELEKRLRDYTERKERLSKQVSPSLSQQLYGWRTTPGWFYDPNTTPGWFYDPNNWDVYK